MSLNKDIFRFEQLDPDVYRSVVPAPVASGVLSPSLYQVKFDGGLLHAEQRRAALSCSANLIMASSGSMISGGSVQSK